MRIIIEINLFNILVLNMLINVLVILIVEEDFI